MASLPQLDNRAFAVITKVHARAIFDAQMVAKLSRDHDGQIR
jgi:hypothetical protein